MLLRSIVRRVARNTPVRHYSISVPYNFEGILTRLDYNKTQQLRAFINQMVDDQLENGFRFAYDSLLDAIAEKDDSYLADVLEENLYKHVLQAFRDINERKLQVQIVNENEVSEVTIGTLAFHYGVNFNRSENRRVAKKSMTLLNLVQLNVYGGGNAGPLGIFSSAGASGNVKPLVQCDAYFHGKRKLVILDQSGEALAGSIDTIPQIHKIRFETVNSGGDSPLDMMSLMQKIGTLRGDPSDKKGVFRDLFFGKDFEWKIADIDDYLNGNDFASE